ncbi:MBL fold metallo-hydrolase [Opitutaceae bacterium EW11]|nr:MBL fold metallo-hydrolase [Opitutaceae bacterium EW11]
MPETHRQTYPLSDHYDGRVFFNPGDFQLPRFSDILRWQLNRQAARWPREVPFRPQPLPPAPAGGAISATWINHASFLLRTEQHNILIDPVFSLCCGPFGRFGPRRVHPPGIALESLPPIHAVFVSHDHYDHCDLPALRQIVRAHRPLAVTPLGNGALLRRAGFRSIVELDWWQQRAVFPELLVSVVPSQHWSNRLSGRRCGRLWGGFYIQNPGGRRVHFVGDTGYHPKLFRQIRDRMGASDLAMVPIGAYEPRWFMKSQHCNPEEAVRIHRELGAAVSVGMHWGTFQLTDEARDEPPAALRRALSDAGEPQESIRILEPGSTLVV